MALHFRAPNAPDHPSGDKSKWHPVTEALVWATMIVGIAKITEKNVDQFTRRIRLFEIAQGKTMLTNEALITRADVAAHIGLSSNANTLTEVQFKKKLLNILEDRLRYEPERSALEACACPGPPGDDPQLST